MKAMFLSDLLIAKKYLPQQLISGLLVSVFMALVMQNLYVVTPALSVMVPFGVAFTVLAFDERDNWQQFRLALPLSRTNVITGRYASFALLIVLGVATGLVATGLLMSVATVAKDIPLLADLMMNFSWQAIVVTAVAGTAFILVTLSATLPLFSRFGMTKGVRFAPFIAVFGSVGLFVLGGTYAAPEFIAQVGAWIQTTEGTLAVSGIALAGSVALYALSCLLSVKLYQNREL